MLAGNIIEQSSIGDTVYVVAPVTIRCKTLSFRNTKLIQGIYTVFETAQASKHLQSVTLPPGTKLFEARILTTDMYYQCFSTVEEAEVWKLIELQTLDAQVEEHLKNQATRAARLLKKVAQKKKYAQYLAKYPELFLKVL